MSSPSSLVQSVYQQWKQFDLPALQKELDEKANELANRQDESEASRKKLVDLCKDFKKVTPEDVKQAVMPVLKCFQSEVDSLSKRSKAGEAAFLTLYKKIIDSSDPSPALEHCLQWQKKAQKCQELELENANLRDTLHQYNKELADVKNQEITIRQLKEKIKTYEEQIDNTIKQKLTDKEAALSRDYDERQKRLLDEQCLSEARCKELEQRADQLENSLQAAQQELFTLKSRSDDVGHARSDEIDILAADLEKANQRAAAAERECESLHDQLRTLSSQNATLPKIECKMELDDDEQHNSMAEKDETKDRQITQLLEEVHRLKESLNTEQDENAHLINDAKQKATEQVAQVEKLREKLANCNDYDDIKQELNVLKAIYFGDAVKEHDYTPANKSLDVLLLNKNKSLQQEKTSLMTKHRKLEAECLTLRNDCESLLSVNEQQKRLVETLERDLMRVRSLHDQTQQDVDGTMLTTTDQSTLDVISDAVGFDRQTIVKQAQSPNNAQALLPIVANQRERLRVRVEELEEINTQLQQQAALFNSRIEVLQSDNVKLYEKIKFLQSYQQRSPGKSTSNNDELMKKYSTDYEASLDPFQRFGAQERQRRYTALSAHDKATLSVSRLIVSNSTARTVFFFYLLLLHCLVFTVLYKLAYTESCQRRVDTECMDKYREHMQNEHGQHIK